MMDKYDRDMFFIWLYDTQKEGLRRYLRSFGVLENSDDIIQEAYTRLYDRMGSFNKAIDREQLVRYLYTIARNIVYDRHRHDKRTNNIKTEADNTVLQNIPDKAPLPEEVYEEKELLEELKRVVEKLPEKIAEAVKGLLDGKTFEIVAHEVGIQVPALKYRLRKAKDLFDTMQ
jgi:RNA polymerase sigma factor (sigma-70 family)